MAIAVVLQNDRVLAWHKTPTTPDIQAGVELAIEAVVKKSELLTGQVESVKIGTTVRASNFPTFNIQFKSSWIGLVKSSQREHGGFLHFNTLFPL